MCSHVRFLITYAHRLFFLLNLGNRHKIQVYMLCHRFNVASAKEKLVQSWAVMAVNAKVVTCRAV